MKLPIPDSFKKLWDEWNLRGVILLSLALQTFLILFAPLRKRSSKNAIIMSIWSGYLLADWAANFAVGLISNSQGNASGSKDTDDLLAFWAPFLLLHLGGPDTITAFALEDNELWLRHLLGLVFQVAAAAYVFFQSFPKNRLWVISTLLVFLAGIIKYAERTRALYLASLNSFRESMLKEPDPGPNYAKLMEEYNSKKEARLPTHIEMIPEPDKESKGAANIYEIKTVKLTDFEVVRHAYDFFEIFKGLVVDLIFSFRERNDSREFFLKRDAEDAFRVIEVELNFIYEVLFTKVAVVHCKLGYFFRFVSFSSVVAASALFYVQEKRGFHKFEVGITYTLLLGAIALDLIAFFMLIFSDWTVAALKKSRENSLVAIILNNFLNISKTRLPEDPMNSYTTYLESAKRFLFRRWSESVSNYNLIHYCLKERPERIDSVSDCCGFLKYSKYQFKKMYVKATDYLGVKGFIDEIKYVSSEPFTEKLRNFIFLELRRKAEIADDSETAKEICSARGDWVLRENGCSNLLNWIGEVTYDESILLWHIATELCYNDEGIAVSNDNQVFCKLLSDYMLYLLVMQPTTMSAVAGIGQIRFRDTCAEATKFFSRGELDPEKEQREACENILGVNTDVKPVAVKGDRSKSVLFDACILAKELRELKQKKWEIMSKVWVELLSYAASHCRANAHAQQLSKGGELITFIWLLMAHFGLGEQFQINEGHARAKLIVGK
ncbi:hypothetical protein L1049_010503 [Liquidambar formosana]|uniref:DUF4220 domain-containing protein n=1 Tax=Liquidambar formosana TaxID=63359 RepID=A0AAP0R4G1_LIQFO